MKPDYHVLLPNSRVEVVTNYAMDNANSAMDNSGNDVEDAGNIELKSFKEINNESRKASIANEETGDRLQAQEKTDCRCISAKAIIWKTFKSIVFLVCLIFLVFQSVEFYNTYREYPTNMVQKSIFIKEVKLPAVTICFKYTISVDKFCSLHEELCETPNNIKQFCEIHPWYCKYSMFSSDLTKLKIPMKVYNGSLYRYRQTLKYLFNDSFNHPRLFDRAGEINDTRTFVQANNIIYKCYSKNLHLYQSESKLATMEVGLYDAIIFDYFELELHRIELFDSSGIPQVFLSIHSPFIPSNPIVDGIVIRSEYSYYIEAQLDREEHLLPPPYETNCQDNGPSKDVKNFGSPNSYEICLEMCDSEFNKAVKDCVGTKTMVSSPREFCYLGREGVKMSPERERELGKRRAGCLQNCRPGCLKLHYKYKAKEAKREGEHRDGKSRIVIAIRNNKITSMRHFPLYGSGAMFSHIGGLLGYWLGISMFTSLDIIEKFFLRAIIWRRRFKKHKAQKTPNSDDLV